MDGVVSAVRYSFLWREAKLFFFARRHQSNETGAKVLRLKKMVADDMAV